jgi:hypothetical protein
MSEIYWITRLDAFNSLLGAFTGISAALSVLFTLLYFVGRSENWEEVPIFKKVIKISIPTFIISTLLCAFTPTKEDMFLIYGVGGTIDYVKQNDKAKQLPDKCINALDAWVDSLNDKDNSNNSHE